MKKITIALLSISLLAACSAGKKDPKAELDSLKKQQLEINDKIKKLEAQIAASDTSGNKEKPKLVAATTLQPGIFQHFVEVQGKVDADQNILVSPEMPGVITSILVTNGQAVKKGQLLATTESSTIQAQIEALKKNLELANTLYEKQKALWEQNIGTEVQYLQAKNQKESLEKNLATLNQQYEMTRIKSPIDGTVDQVIAKLGQAGSPGVPAFRVVNLTQMKVVADVAESYTGKVKVGDQVSLYFPDANQTIIKKITAVSQVIDPTSRSFAVDVRLDNQDKAFFHPNMVSVMKICDYTNPSAIVVPINTVQNSENGKFVFIASNTSGKNLAVKQTIVSGVSYGDKTEIISGLKAGDQLITIGYQDLSDGQLISTEVVETAQTK